MTARQRWLTAVAKSGQEAESEPPSTGSPVPLM